MTVALITHDTCIRHDTGWGHPETSDRLKTVLAVLTEDAFPSLLRVDAPLATEDQLAAVHGRSYVEKILALDIAPGELRAIDPDTILSDASVEAALRGAGGAIMGVDLVVEGSAQSAFVAARPPGHHAERARAMGFCLFNNVAIAAQHARSKWGLKRIAVADFDVHHGNGTQQAFWDDPDLFFASSHQSPCYPGTGERHERGAANNIANAPLPPGTGSAGFRQAWRDDLLCALDAFAPELLIVSAGFDAHRRDPLANLLLDTDDYVWITRELVRLAQQHAEGRIISVLEGGYDLPALAEAVSGHIRELEAAGRGPSHSNA